MRQRQWTRAASCCPAWRLSFCGYRVRCRSCTQSCTRRCMWSRWACFHRTWIRMSATFIPGSVNRSGCESSSHYLGLALLRVMLASARGPRWWFSHLATWYTCRGHASSLGRLLLSWRVRARGRLTVALRLQRPNRLRRLRHASDERRGRGPWLLMVELLIRTSPGKARRGNQFQRGEGMTLS
jgi:hypothetical protein